MELHINVLAVFAAALAGFVVGAIWFGPKTFYPMWIKAQGKSIPQRGEQKGMAGVFAATFLAQLAMAFTGAVVIDWYEGFKMMAITPMEGLNAGLLLGVGVAAAASLSHRLFSQVGFKVWAIEVGQDIVGFAVMGLILASWR